MKIKINVVCNIYHKETLFERNVSNI